MRIREESTMTQPFSHQYQQQQQSHHIHSRINVDDSDNDEEIDNELTIDQDIEPQTPPRSAQKSSSHTDSHLISQHNSSYLFSPTMNNATTSPPQGIQTPKQLTLLDIEQQQQQQQQQQELQEEAGNGCSNDNNTTTFVILGRRVKCTPTADYVSQSLYAFSRAWFLSHSTSQSQTTSSYDRASTTTSNSSRFVQHSSTFISNNQIVPKNQCDEDEQTITSNAHSNMLTELVRKNLIYASGTDMFEKMNINRRKIQKKKTLLADLKKWAKKRKVAYLQFHMQRSKEIEMRIQQQCLIVEDSPNPDMGEPVPAEHVDLLCEE